MAGEAVVESASGRDELLSSRFDRRVHALFTWAIPVHIVLIIASYATDGLGVTAVAHLAMATMAWSIVRTSADAVRTIIFTHVYWTFSFMTYAYALLHLQEASYGLGNSDRAALIALVSQGGLLLASQLPPKGCVLASDRAQLYGDRRAMFERLQWPLFAAGLLGIYADYAGLLPASYSSALTLLLYVALAIRLTRRRTARVDYLTWCIFGALLVLSASSNNRTDLLAMVLLLGFALLVTARRLFTAAMLIGGYVAWRLMAAFSSLVLSIRWARNGARSTIDLFFEGLFSEQTLLTLVNPFHRYENSFASVAGGPSRFSSAFFNEGSSDLLGRLTVLPQMDIVTARLTPESPIRWNDLWNIVQSALPSIGQVKDLTFSDTVVWELGLRSTETLGRPMITAEGELFAIAGYWLLPLVGVCFYVMHVLYRMLAVAVGSRAVSILVFSQFAINAIFSTTVLSVLAETMRTPIQVLLLAVCLFITNSPRRVRTRGRSAT